jgi:hypothetical protein
MASTRDLPPRDNSAELRESLLVAAASPPSERANINSNYNYHHSSPRAASSSASSHRSRRFRCGVNETRSFYIILPLLMIFFFGYGLEILAFLVLSVLVLVSIVILLRLYILAKIRSVPTSVTTTIPGTDTVHTVQTSTSPGAAARTLESALGREFFSDLMNLNPTAIRLAMQDRDFDANDYEMLLRLDEEHKATQFNGLTRSQINRLPTYTIKPNSKTSSPEEENNCLICLEPKEVNQEVRLLPCFHDFHRECIDKWLSESCSCPIDKAKISLPAE